jgi:hypothetical protein
MTQRIQKETERLEVQGESFAAFKAMKNVMAAQVCFAHDATCTCYAKDYHNFLIAISLT